MRGMHNYEQPNRKRYLPRNRRCRSSHHQELGPGLLETVYETILARELTLRDLHVVRQQPIPIIYDNVRFDEGFRADLVVEEKIIIELKSVEQIAPVHKKQLLTYLRLSDKRLGLLIKLRRGPRQRWHPSGRESPPRIDSSALCGFAPLRETNSGPLSILSPREAAKSPRTGNRGKKNFLAGGGG